MPATPVVARAPRGPRFRTLDGQTVVGIEDTHSCGDCYGRGSKWLRWPTVKPCPTCHGSGRLLDADPLVWPIPVVEIPKGEDGEAAVGTGPLRKGRRERDAHGRSPRPAAVR